jgi:biopolymer transport protein ExbD
MNFSKAKHTSTKHSALNLSSMIDVTFLLLIYFIVTTVIATPEELLKVALKVEQSSSVTVDDFEPQIILVTSINTQSVYQIGDRSFTDRIQLAQFLEVLPKEPGVIVRVTNFVPVSFAVAAIQEARNSGFEKVTYVPVLP